MAIKPTGNVTIDTIPPGALVTLNGKTPMPAPLSFKMVATGHYNVAFSIDGKALNGDFYVIKDSTTRIIADFDRGEIIEHQEDNKNEAWLQSYEPNRVGLTYDSNDSVFMDFTLSLQYPFASKSQAVLAKFRHADDNKPYGLWTKYLRPLPYLAFTGRFGQYATRSSKPVIGKRFNPKFFLRFFTSDPDNSYLDFGYAHESNGQRIDSAESYQSRLLVDPEFANDLISRGWDYWEVAWYKNINDSGDETGSGFSGHISLKYFLADGYLQEGAEEYNAWENDSNGKPRKEVDGITIKLAHKRQIRDMFNLGKIPFGAGGGALIYTTGYKKAFTNNTIRGEYLVKVGSVPLLLWISEGYNSDLVDYYRRIRSFGFCLDLNTF